MMGLFGNMFNFKKTHKFNLGDRVYMNFCENSGKIVEVGYDGDPDAYVILVDGEDEVTEVAQGNELMSEKN